MRDAAGLRALYIGITAAVLSLDFWSKRWAAARLRTGPDVDVVDGFLRLTYAENPGIAFSLFSSGAGATRWALAAFSTLAAVVVVVVAARASARQYLLQTTLALLLAGIVGNLVDRVRTGRVIDFIDVYVGAYHWPTFNVADSAITVGAVLLAIEMFRAPEPRKEKGAAESAGETP